MKTATLYYSANLCNFERTLPRFYYQSASYPLPEKSTLKGAIIESMTTRANGFSIIKAAA